MTTSDSSSRGLLKCRSCGSVFPSARDADGTVRPIGVSKDCTCGDADFQLIG